MAAELAIIAKLQDDASSGIRALRGEVEGLGESGGIAAKGFQALQSVGTVALTALAAAAAAVGGAIVGSIGIAADFQDSVTLLAIAAKGAGESFDSMRAAAMAVGADTSLVGVSASGAADALTILYKAGLSTGEIFGDLNGYLAGNVELSGALRAAVDGAAASELDMAQAADLAAMTLATFGGELKTTEERAAFVNMAMNNFVQAADASLASVSDLAAAMATIGPTAAQFGFSLQDTNTALAILSTRGIAGAEAGTALKSMLTNLMRDTPAVTGALNELGVSLYNADGTMRSLPQIIGDLSQALYGLNERTVMVGGRTAEQNHQLDLARKSYDQATDAIYKHNAGLKTLTDSQLAKYINQQSAANAEIQRLEAITGKATTAVSQLTEEQRNQYIQTLAGSYGMKAMATLLMEGTEGWTAMEKAIAAAATIQEVARARTETFSGAMEMLNGVIETIRIGIGSAFLPVLTALARAFADLAAENLPAIVDTFEAFGGALASFFDAVMGGTPVITAFADAVGGLAEYFGMPAQAVEELKAKLEAFLIRVMAVITPIAQAVTSFVSWKDVLVAVGIAIGSVVIPVLLALTKLLLPIIAVFGGLILVIAAVRNAFETNFLGIQTLALSLWSSLQQVFEGIRALLSGDTTAAMAAFRSAWESGWNAIVAFIQNAGSQIGQALAGLWQSIVAWFQGVDWGALGQSLIQRFFDGMAALGQAAAGRWEWLLTSITSFIQSVNWAQVGAMLVDLLAKGILGAVGLVATAIAGIVTFIWNFITGTNWIELGVNLVNAILDGFSAFVGGVGAKLAEWKQAIFDWAGAEDWGGVAEKISSMVGEKLGEAGDAVSAKLSEWQAAIFDWAGSEDWQGVAEHIAEGVGEKLGEAGDAVSAKLSEWQAAIFDWAGSEDWQGVAEHIAEGVGEKLGEAGDAISSKLSEWQAAIFDWAGSEDWQGVAEHIAEEVGLKLGETADSVSAQLVSWRDAILEWAGSEDWSGVALTITEAVSDMLSNAADSLVSGLLAWYDTIFSWAASEDWGEVGAAIVNLVLEGLTEFVDNVGDTIDSWWNAFTNAVDNIDWYQIAYDIVFQIVEGLLEFGIYISTTVAGWYQTFMTLTEGMTWSQIALLIVGAIVAGLIELNIRIYNAALEWYGKISDAVNGFLASVFGLGRSIVEGLVDGIMSMHNALVAAAAGVIGGAIDAIRAALGNPHSPAPALIPIGSTISEGLAAGILQSGGLVTSAIGQVAANMKAAGVEAFGEAMSAIAQGIGAALSAALDIALFQGPGGGFSSGLRAISEMMAELVTVLAGANTHSAEVLEELSAFLEVVGEIAGVLASVHSATGLVMNWQPPPLNIVTLAFERMAGYLAVMVTVLNGLTLEAVAVVSELGDFVTVASQIGELLGSVHSAVGAAMNFQAPPLDVVAYAVGVMAQHLAAVMMALFEANRFGLGSLAILTEFAGTALAIAEMIGPAIDAMHELNAFGGVGLSTFHEGVAQLAYTLLIVMQAFMQANVFGSAVLEMVRDFAETGGEIAAMMGPAIEAMHELNKFGSVGLDKFHEGVAQLAYTLLIVVQAFVRANTFGSAVLEMVREFVETAAEISDLIVPAIEAMHELNKFGSVGLNKFHEGVAQLAYTLHILVAEFVRANTFGAATLAAARDFADTVGEIVDVVGDGIEALGLVAGYESDAAALAASLRKFAADLVMLVQLLASAFAAASAQLGAAAALGAAFAEHAGDILDVVEPGIEALAALAGYVAASGVRTRVQAFAADLLAVVRELGLAFAAASAQMGEAAGQGAEFAGHAEDIIDVVEPGIEAIAALAGYVAASGVREKTALFANDLMQVLQALGDAFMLATAEIIAMAAEGAEFAGHVEDIVDVIEPGIDAIVALSGYVAASGIQASVQAFAYDLMQVLVALGDVFALATAEMLSAAEAGAEFAGHVEDIVDVIEPGIEAIAALAGYVAASGLYGQTVAFAADLIIVVQTILDGLTQSGLLTNDAAVAAGELADGIGDLVGMVADGVEALAALATYVSATGIGGAVQTFAADLVTVVLELVNAFQQAGLLANSAVTEAGEMAGALGDIVSVVAPAVEAVVALVGYTTVGGLKTNAQQFAADLVIVVQTLVDGLAQAGMLANAAVAEAGEMAKAIESVLKVVEPALHPEKGALPLLANYISAGGLLQKTQQFTSDLIMVTQTLVDGLTQSALAAGVALAKAGEMAKSIKDLYDAIGKAIFTIGTIAAYTSASGLVAKTQQFTNDLIAVATILVAGLVSAADALGSTAVSAAHAFAQAVSLIAERIQTILDSFSSWSDMGMPNVTPILAYIIQSAEQITSSFAAAGDIGAAVGYAEAFRANLEQLVNEVQLAVAQLNALAGAGTSGSVGAALAAIAGSLQNTEGQFAGAGKALADALIDAMASGVGAGQGTVVQAQGAMLTVVMNAGMTEARDFQNVGEAISENIADGVSSEASKVLAAVVQAVAAAVAAGLNEAKKAAAIGEEIIKTALAEVNAGRGQLDSAGSAAGSALIDGMVRAITSGKSRLVNAIKDAVNSAVAAAKAALGIASPSRVAFELIDNFMRTAEGRFADASGLAAAVGRSIDVTMTAAARRLAQVRLDVPVSSSGGSISRMPIPPVVGSRPTAGAPAFEGSGRGATVNVYGNIVLPNVSNPVSFLEELDRLRGGG